MREATLEQQNRELAKAVKFECEGMISHVERMGVEVARDAAQRQCLSARDDARIARLRLQRLLQSEAAPKLTTPLFVLKKAPADMEEWTKRALAGNPQLSAADARVKQAEQGVEASRANFMPQIFAFGEYFLVQHYLSPIEPVMMAGVGASLTLWDAKDRKAAYKSAKATYRAAKSTHADTANTLLTAVETAWINTGNAREQYELTASDLALARENLRLKSQGFYEGLYTSLAVSEARDQLLQAELGRRVAAYNFVVNFATLHALTGDMAGFMAAFSDKDAILEE